MPLKRGQQRQGEKPCCALVHTKGTDCRHWLHLAAAAASGDHHGFPRLRAGKPWQPSGKERTINLGVDGKGLERAGPLRALGRTGPYVGAG